MKKLLGSRWLQFAFGLLVSGAVIVWLYFSIKWDEVFRELARARLWIVAPSLLLMVVHYIIRSLRWGYLLPDGEQIPLRHRFDSLMVGNFATFVLPLRAGEFVRPFLLSRLSDQTFARCFVSVVIERFFDLATILLLFGLMVLYIPGIPGWANAGASSLLVLAAAIFAFMLLGSFFPVGVMRLVDLSLKVLPGGLRPALRKFLNELVEGSAILRRKSNLVKVLVYTALVWGSAIVQFYVYLYFLPGVVPSFWLTVSIVVIIALAVAAPSAPGFIGVYQVGSIAAFALFGLSEELGTAYSIITHIFSFMCFICYGLFLLFKYQLSMSDLQGQAERG